MAESTAIDFTPTPSGETPPAEKVDFTPSGEAPHDAMEDHRRYLSTYTPSAWEKTSDAWNKATHGLFAGLFTPVNITPYWRKTSPEIKPGWRDVPDRVGHLLLDPMMVPGNVLGAVFMGGAPKAIQEVGALAFGVYQGAVGLTKLPALAERLTKDKKVTPESTIQAADAGISGAIGALGLASLHPTPVAAVEALGRAMGELPLKDAAELFSNVNRRPPSEVAKILQDAAAEAKDVKTTGSLTAASREFQKLAALEPKEVRRASEAYEAMDEVKSVLAPQTRGNLARVTAGSLREMAATLAQRHDRATAALEKSSAALMKLDPETRWGAVDDIENGRPQPTPELQAFADTARQMMDSLRDEIRGMGEGKLEKFIDDYFPHVWKDPEAAVSVFSRAAAKAPLQGSRAFLKQRTIPTIAEGRALGLEPVSSNPVDLLLLKAREMNKFILANKWFDEMQAKGLVQMVRSGELPPEGYVEINDKIATVYGPRTGAVSFSPETNTLTVTPSDVTVHGQRIMGKYYAPSEVATVANNYLSPGLRRYASFRGYMSLANSLNRFQLGLSAFHLGFTTLDTSISKLALAIQYAGEGNILKATKTAVGVPFAPFTTFFEGNRMLKEWMTPGSQGAEIARLTDAARIAGGRARMDDFYQTSVTKNMVEMWNQGKVVGAAWRAPFAAMEQVTKPVMEYVVPRQKLGVAADLLRREMENLPRDATIDQVREAYDRAWDSVDNRMGQLVYDNLFWNKTFKDLAMASVRSVGWDLGTIREIGGGILDVGKVAKSLAAGEFPKKGDVSPRFAYVIALPMLTGIIGATFQYLYTGKGPQELRDYFFPKTGEKDPQGRDVRLAMPTYMKDVYHYAHDPVGTVEGKVSPFPAAVMQMLNNKDFFGHDIRNADDPFIKQLTDEAKFFGGLYEPISIRQFAQATAAQQTKRERAAAFVGVTRAPAWVGETAAEQLAAKLTTDRSKGFPPSDEAKVAARNQIMLQLRSKDPDKVADAYAKMAQMVAGADMTAAQRRNLIRGVDHSFLENQVAHLDAKEALRVFRAASPEERESLVETIQLKIARAHLSSEDKDALQAEFEKLRDERSTRNPYTSYRK